MGRRDLRALAVPLLVLDGPAPPPHVVAASEALAEAVPGARRGGTRPEAVAALLELALARQHGDRPAPPRQPRGELGRAATGASGSAAAVISASRLRSGALRLSAWKSQDGVVVAPRDRRLP